MREILLVFQTLVVCHEKIEPLCHGGFQKFTIRQLTPAPIEVGRHGVPGKKCSKGNRSALVKEGLHEKRGAG